MCILAVADTPTLILYITIYKRLSNEALSFLKNIDDSGKQIAISSMTLVEIVYLAEKDRISQDLLDFVVSFFDDIDSSLVEIVINNQIAQTMKQIPREQIPEMPDRIISATALYLEVPLITNDLKIRSSLVQTIW
ncbi:MAG: PIN domain-containing protein [Chloroflexota bacterium]